MSEARDNRIVVAMSGGVDSAAAALILRRGGFDPCGVVIRFSEASSSCVAAAKKACDTLGMPLEVVDARAEFERGVVAPFCDAYCAARTPNPCVVCNPRVKFKALISAADALGCRLIATGHYAQIEESGGFFRLKRARSAKRDQSYMLCSLSQETLSRLVLPLGDIADKSEARELAGEAGLECAGAPDSQEICFIPEGDYAAFIRARGLKGKPGRFIAPDGTPLGPHLGAENYTVGQRRGLNVALGEPVFVGEIEPSGDIKLVYDAGRYSSAVSLVDFELNPFYEKSGLPKGFTVKIRSAAPPAPCSLEANESGALVRFEAPARAPAPGQRAVLYDGDYVAASGEIDVCFK